MGVNNSLQLGVGNVSLEEKLEKYYQDLVPAIYHFNNNSLGGGVDDNGTPYLIENGQKYYSVVYIIQFGLISHDLMVNGLDVRNNETNFFKSIDWLEKNKVDFKDSIIWRNKANKQYKLNDGWVSGMYIGQAISLYLRMYQYTSDKKYLRVAEKAYEYFKYDYTEGGVKRIDKNDCIWFEEYPTDPPSLVLNGFIYTIFGILDFYRVTKRIDAWELYDSCIYTLEVNLHKYHRWYWSVYDQGKKELVSYYYQKNVHIPLMQILYKLSGKEVFSNFASKWKDQLDSKFNKTIVQIMYRIQPRLKKYLNV